MRKLNRIILINSAGFDYVEFPVGDHTQVIGVNGHGKSTLLRTVLFFYLGTNEKAPFALHETKSDFVSHYLGNPPAYLIYEVSRGPEEPSFHIAVTRPAGRIQFHFVDAPFRKDYYIDGNFVQSVDAVSRNLRDGKCSFESVSSYEDFNRRIYGLIPTPYSVFRPAPRSSGNAGILHRIISGIFTVSQLDADKLKSVLTCGVNQDSLSTELDLILLKNQLQNFRRVNRAVRTYLRYETEASALINLADQFETTKTERQHAIEELVRMAKRLPQEERGLSEQQKALDKEQAEAEEQFNFENGELSQILKKVGEEIFAINKDIDKGEETATEYQTRDIDHKSNELDRLPAINEELRSAKEEYDSLTSEYENEKQQKERLLASAQHSWIERSRQVAEKRATYEKKLRENIERIEKDRKLDLDRLEDEFSSERLTEQEQLRRVTNDRDNLNKQFRELANSKEPAELNTLRTSFEKTASTLREEISKQEILRNQVSLEKEKAIHERVRIDQDTETVIQKLDTSIKTFEEEHEKRLNELDNFDSSLASFFQTEMPQSWEQASKTFNRDTLFQNAIDLDAKISADGSSSAWGVEILTEHLPYPITGYNREELTDALQKNKMDLAEEHDKRQAAHERYLVATSEHDQRVAETRNKLESEVHTSQELSNKLQDEKVHLENRILTLDSQYSEDLKQRRKSLDDQEVIVKEAEQYIHKVITDSENRHKTRLQNIRDDFDEQREDLDRDSSHQRSKLDDELEAAREIQDVEVARIEQIFEESLSNRGVDTNMIQSAQNRVNQAEQEIEIISQYQTEVTQYKQLKKEYIDPLPSHISRKSRLVETKKQRTREHEQLVTRHEEFKKNRQLQQNEIDITRDHLQKDGETIQRFKRDPRFAQELGFFSREDLVTAAFYRVQTIKEFEEIATSSHEQLAAIGKNGDRDARAFLNHFDSETLDRKVLGFSPIHPHFNWFIFVGSELKPFVNGHGIQGMKQIQTQEFEQLIRNICAKNADFNEGIRQVSKTAKAIESHLQENNFVDVLDSIELKVDRIDSNLTRILSQLEQFADVSFNAERDLFGKQANQSQIDKAVETFEKLLREIDSYRGQSLQLIDCFDFSIRVHENGHDMGWRKSLDHIGSTGTDYLVKMLIYLSLIEIYRERAIDSNIKSMVHCILDETGVLAPKYVLSVLEYAQSREIILITAGHSQQTMGFNNWMHVRKCGSRFAAQTVLRKVLKCD